MAVELNQFLNYNNAYFLDEWIKYNEDTWGVKGIRVCYQEEEKEYRRFVGVIYLNSKGKIVLPPNNTYLPFRFYHTNTKKNCQIYSQWMKVSEMLADDFCKRGWEGTIVFPPSFIDGRALQWKGIRVSTGYTFTAKLPYNEAELDTSVRKNCRKAEKLGYRVERTHDWENVVYCLNKTATFKGFDDLITPTDLQRSYDYLGDTYLFAHIAYNSDNKPVSAQVKLAMPDGLCIDWLAGTDREYVNDGVNQLLYMKSLQDIVETGTLFFDYCGANIENVARAKATWGFELTPYLVIPENEIKEKIKSIAKQSALVKKVYYTFKRIQKNNFRK